MENKNEKTVTTDSTSVRWYFLSPSGATLHSREYPAGRIPLGCLWVSINGEGEVAYRTSTSRSLLRSDRKATSQPGGYRSSDGVCELIGETPALLATDERVVAFLAAQQATTTAPLATDTPAAETASPEAEKAPETKSKGKSGKK